MDAQELQRLKELAEFWAGKYHSSIPAVRQGWREAWGELETFVCNFGERAVSPAESVQSINDCEAYNSAMGELARVAAVGGAMTLMKKQQALSKIIDAQLVKDHNSGYTAGRAEGRRSALEELHPQWLKEKERADRAKAVRQVPDLGHLPCYKLSDGRLIPVGIVKTIIDRGDMMLSLLDVRTALLAQPLQQPGPVGVGEDGETTNDYCAKRLRMIAQMLGLGSSIPEKNADLWACAFSVLGMVRRELEKALAKPSDKLQQASTAQVEPATNNAEVAPSIVVSATDAGQDDFSKNLRAFAMLVAEEAIKVARGRMQSVASDHVRAVVDGVMAWDIGKGVIADLKATAAPSQATPEGADLPPLPHTTYNGYSDGSEPLYTADQMRDYARATVVDMDRLLRASVPERHKSCTSPVGSVQSYIAELEEATTAAEPVYQVISRDAYKEWVDVNKERMGFCQAQGYLTRTLYYAATPQKVELSDEFLRKAIEDCCECYDIIRSHPNRYCLPMHEMIEFIQKVANGVNPYHEQLAKIKQVDTGGLPG